MNELILRQMVAFIEQVIGSRIKNIIGVDGCELWSLEKTFGYLDEKVAGFEENNPRKRDEWLEKKAEMINYADYVNSFRDHYQEILEYVSKERNAFLFSPGAAASRHVREHYNLSKPPYCVSKPGYGHAGHVSGPQYLPIENFKAVYVVSHPIDTVLSYYNRKMIIDIETSVINGGNSKEHLKFIHNNRLKQDFENISIDDFFELYTQNNIDFFNLDVHIKNWIHHKDVLAIKYDDLTKKHDEIIDWFGYEKSFPVFPWKERKSTRTMVSKETVTKLEKFYEKAIEEFNEIR